LLPLIISIILISSISVLSITYFNVDWLQTVHVFNEDITNKVKSHEVIGYSNTLSKLFNE